MKQMKRRTFLKAFAAVAISLVTRGGGGDGVKPSLSEPKLPEPKESADALPGGGFPEWLKEYRAARMEHRTMWTSEQHKNLSTHEDVVRFAGVPTTVQVSQDGENWVDLDGFTAESVHYKFTESETAWEYKNGFPVRYHTNELLEDACIGLPKGFVELDIKGTYEES